MVSRTSAGCPRFDVRELKSRRNHSLLVEATEKEVGLSRPIRGRPRSLCCYATCLPLTASHTQPIVFETFSSSCNR